MMVYQDADAMRQQLAAQVEAQARKDGLHNSDSDEVIAICEARIAAAFVKARLCPKDMNSNHKRIAAAYGAQVADNLRKS